MNDSYMNDRYIRILLIVIAVLLIALLARPYLERAIESTQRPAAEPRAIAPRASLTEFEQTSIKVFENTAPSVVQIVVTRGTPFSRQLPSLPAPGQQGQNIQGGTGFVWDNQGHIVTNAHVVGTYRNIVVRLSTGETVSASPVGRAPNYDLAVIKLDRSTNLPPPIPLGSVNDLKVGQLAFAIGNPYGFDQSMSLGIISALKRRLPTSGGREIANVIQTDATINPGNSGGPLIDSAARLIGVTTAIFSPSGANTGIGFAIPADVVNRVVPQLIRAGRVPTPGIGILAADEATSAELGVTGVVVYEVVPNSPAERAKIRGISETGEIGDIVVAADGKPVKHLTDLTDVLETIGVGHDVKLTIQRDSRKIDVTLPIVDIGETSKNGSER